MPAKDSLSGRVIQRRLHTRHLECSLDDAKLIGVRGISKSRSAGRTQEENDAAAVDTKRGLILEPYSQHRSTVDFGLRRSWGTKAIPMPSRRKKGCITHFTGRSYEPSRVPARVKQLRRGLFSSIYRRQIYSPKRPLSSFVKRKRTKRTEGAGPASSLGRVSDALVLQCVNASARWRAQRQCFVWGARLSGRRKFRVQPLGCIARKREL